MKTFWILIGLVASLAVAVVADSEQYMTVNVRVVAEGVNGRSSGSGGFTVKEGTYGRTTLSFYGDGKSFRVVASGSKVGPVLHITGRDGYQPHTNDLWMTMDLYLKPRVTPDGQIKLTGSILSMIRSGDDDPPVYQYEEENLEYVIPNGGREFLARRHSEDWKKIQLEISASSEQELAYEPKTFKYLEFHSDYSLLNESTSQFESKDCKCTLGFGAADQTSAGSCGHRKIFHLDSGDSLLLLTSFEISNIRWLDDDRFSFDFDIARHYALNPYDADTLTSGGVFMNLGEHGLAAERMTIRDFHREITTRHGETTEIEIPSDDDNMLPFPFVERIVLTNTIKTKSY